MFHSPPLTPFPLQVLDVVTAGSSVSSITRQRYRARSAPVHLTALPTSCPLFPPHTPHSAGIPKCIEAMATTEPRHQQVCSLWYEEVKSLSSLHLFKWSCDCLLCRMFYSRRLSQRYWRVPVRQLWVWSVTPWTSHRCKQ